jgi:hypothetical protein
VKTEKEADMSESLYPEIRFVGRQNEIERFESLLKQLTREKWAVFLWGEGGIGKTQLLKRFLQIAAETFPPEKGGLVFSEDSILDLYWTENRREESLLKNLAIRLDAGGFQEFFNALRAYEEGASAEEDVVTSEKLRDAFLSGYKNLEAQHIVLAFDTAERVTESVLRFFRGYCRICIAKSQARWCFWLEDQNHLKKSNRHLGIPVTLGKSVIWTNRTSDPT